MSWLVPLITLTAMEVVLGIDNIIFIAILSGRLPEHQRAKARSLGLLAATVTRVLLLLSISFVLRLTAPVFHLSDLGIPADWVQGDPHLTIVEPVEAEGAHADTSHLEHDIDGVSWRDLILMGGGLFLIFKSVLEIHHKIEGSDGQHANPQPSSFSSVIIQIGLLDIIFSLDSVITAVGMAKEIWVMILAVVLAIGVMLIFAGRISEFVERHPTIKVLALSFLILIGVLLVAEGFGTPVNKGYVYFAMAFSLVVELVNMRVSKGRGVIPNIGPLPDHETPIT